MARSRKLEVVVAGDAKDLSRTFKKVDQDAAGVEKRMHRVSSAFKVMGAAAAGAAVVGLKAAVDTAVDVSESLSKNRVLFGQYAKDIDKFSKTSATSFGISRSAALEATGTFGNLFSAVGVAPKKAAELSVEMTKLASDMASFNNASPEEALEAIRSGLVGESEPLRKFGVNINDATLRQEALHKGLIKTTKDALTPQQKALAAQSLIVKQTSKAHGDFERTSKGLANQQRILKAEVSDLGAVVGKAVLPALTKAAQKTTDFVKGMRDGTGAGGRFADKLKEIADRVRPIVKFFTDHPRLIAVAVGAWVTYRVAAAAALAITRLRLLGMFGGLGPKAAAGGAVAGRAFGGAAAASSGTTFQRRAPGALGGGKMRGAFRGAGTALGAVMGAAILGEIINQIEDRPGGPLRDILRGALPLSPQPGNPGIRVAKPGETVIIDGKPYVVNKDGETVPLQPPTSPQTPLPAPRRPSRRPRPASGPGQNAPGGAGARAHTSRVRAHVSSASPVARASANSGIVALGRQLQREGYTVGEHPAFGGVAPVHVQNSYHYRGMAIDVNGGPGGEPGSLDALHARLVGRPGVVELLWRVTGHFDHLHVAVSGATNPLSGSATIASGGEGIPATGPVQRRAPLPLTATLIGGAGGGSKAPKGMGGRVPADRVGGFWPTISREQIDVLSGDPKTNPKSRTARLFQLGTRRNRIIEALTTGQAKTQETRDRLLGELTSIDSEIADLTGATGGLENIPGYAAYLGSLDKEAALAELTPDTAGDQDVARRLLKARQDALAYAQSHGFSDSDIAQAARDVKSAQDAVDSGDTATTALTDAIKDFSEQLKRQNDLHERVAGITSTEAVKFMADMLSGEVGARMSLRALTPGNGRRADY